MSELTFLELGGKPFERGCNHGEALKVNIEANIDTYLDRFLASGLNTGAAIKEGNNWIKPIQEQNEDYAEEMRGISEGAGIDLGKIAMLNARYEITFGLMKDDAQKFNAHHEPDGCTTFGALPEATKNGHTILGQNWDWLSGIYGHTVVTKIKNNNKPDLLFYTEAGIVGGKMGLNEHGIGLVENGLVSEFDGQNKYKKPFHLRCREVLEGTTINDAMATVLSTPRVCSANFVIGHADGEIINLEASPNAVSTHFPLNGLITHSNHFMDARHGISQMEKLNPSTLFRANRLDKLLRKNMGKLATKHYQLALSDHFGFPNSICRHIDESLEPSKQTMTNASFIIDLNERQMKVSNGPPCEHSYQTYAI